MVRFYRLDIWLIRLLAGLFLLGAVLSSVGFSSPGDTGQGQPASSAFLDGGGFPTPTATLIPTLAATNTATTIPQEVLIPTATTIPYPLPTFDSNLVNGGEAQTQPEAGSRSPSLIVLALPFLCAAALLVGVVVYWVRNTRSSSA